MKVKFILLTGVIISMAAISRSMAASAKSAKPNIIIVFADDISAREFPIYGSDTWSSPEAKNTSNEQYRAKTPILDKLYLVKDN